MKPLLSVVADIKVGARNVLNNISRHYVYSNAHGTFVIPSQKHWLGLLLYFLFPFAAHTTTVFTLVGPDFVVTAADSRITRATNPVSFGDGCKTKVFGDLVVSVVGVTTWPTTGFDAWTIVTEAVRGKNTFDSATANFQKLALPEIAKAIPSLREKDPSAYEIMVNRATAFCAVFAKIEKGRPIADVSCFQLDKEGKLVPPKPDPEYGAAERLGVIVTGQNNFALNAISNSRGAWETVAKIDPPKAARGYVQLEAIASALMGNFRVGVPISVLTIDKNGIRWAVIDGEKQNGKCPEEIPGHVSTPTKK